MKNLLRTLFVAVALFAGVSVDDAAAGNDLQLSEAIDEALKHNPEINTFQSRLDGTRARANQAGYLEDPELNIEAWGIPLNQPASIRSSNPIVLGLRQKVPFFGNRALKSEISAREVRMAEEELRSKQIEVVAKVKTAYADYFLAQRAIEIAKAHLDITRQVSLTAENLYKVGKTPQQDVIKALLEQTDLLNRINSAERELATIQARLNALLNRHPSAQIGAAAAIKPTPLSGRLEDLERLALEHQPELRGLEQNLRRSEKAIELARRNQRYPDFMLGLEYWVAPDQKQRHMYTPMISLTVPFSPWTKGKHDFAIEEALAARRAAQAQFEATRTGVLLALREMFVKARAAEKSLSLYEEGLMPQAQHSFEAAVAAYQTGQINFATMLEAQRSIREARLGYYKALVEYEQSVVDIEKSVGMTLPRQVKK